MRVLQAGGLVARHRGAHDEFLLVTSKRNPAVWVLPKGHVEPGESVQATALREVREEAGVEAEILAPLGEVEFTLTGRKIVVSFFLMRFVREVAASESRQVRWCRYEEALAAIEFEATRRVLTRGTELFSTDPRKKAPSPT